MLDDTVPSPHRRLPPKTSIEWLEKINQPNWPSRTDGEELGQLGQEFDSQQAIAADLEKHAPLDIKILEEVEAELFQLEGKLGVYADVLFENRQRDVIRKSKVTGGLRLAPHPAFLTELYDRDLVAAYTNTKSNQKVKSSSGSKYKESKKVQDSLFPGFLLDELNPLPSQLEGPQILVKITHAQEFKCGYMKLWKQVFLSPASVAILHDAFWWFYLDQFQPDNVEAKTQLFARIGDSYVALFCNINPDFKDKFFQHYADCLAQAIFTTFCLAYPDSRSTFHRDQFKNRLVNVLWEWITGVQPPAGSWARWKLRGLDPGYAKSIPIDKDGASHQVHKRGSRLSFDLSDIEPVLPMAQRSLTPGTRSVTGSLKPTKLALSPVKFRSVAQSSLHSFPAMQKSEQVGPGPGFERVLFNTKGHSPLVAHYLQSRQLLAEGPTDYMKRTQVATLPPLAPTYQEVIRHAKRVGNKLREEYDRDQMMFLKEEKRIHRENLKLRQEFQRLTREILSHRHEVKMLSERLVDSMLSDSHIPIGSLLASILNPIDMSDLSESMSEASVSPVYQGEEKAITTTESRQNSSQSLTPIDE